MFTGGAVIDAQLVRGFPNCYPRLLRKEAVILASLLIENS